MSATVHHLPVADISFAGRALQVESSRLLLASQALRVSVEHESKERAALSTRLSVLEVVK